MNEVHLFFATLSAQRFSALVGIGVFLIAAEVLGRKREGLSGWAWNSVGLALLGARLGFIAENLHVFAQHPLSVFYVWQGGFSPLWGSVAALAYTLWQGRSRVRWQLAALGLGVWGLTTALITPAARAEVSLPEMTLESLAGEPLELRALQGKPLVINLWATWCGPCRRELPMLTEVAQTSGATFVLAEQAGSAAQVRDYVRERGLSETHIYRDPGQTLARHFGATGLPTTLFLASDGSVAYWHVGEISRAMVFKQLRRLE